MNQQKYRKLVSGQKQQPGAKIIRALLRIPSAFYGCGVLLRGLCYDKGLIRPYRPPVPVISIGNITVGGTGKTPLVIWLCRFLDGKNLRSVILTRGYKTGNGQIADEPDMIAHSCPVGEVIINSRRSQAAVYAIKHYNPDILIMDDGFQHRKLARDLDIIAIDATCPFGYDKLLPAGLLREPPSRLGRAHAAIITRSDQTTAEQLTEIEKRLKAVNPQITIAYATHQPVGLVGRKGERIPLDHLQGKKTHAFCAIGNPKSFFETLRNLDAKVTVRREFNDHHRYSSAEIAEIFRRAKKAGAELIVCTEKDFARAKPLAPPNSNIQLAYLAVELKITHNAEQLHRQIEQILPAKAQKQDSDL